MKFDLKVSQKLFETEQKVQSPNGSKSQKVRQLVLVQYSYNTTQCFIQNFSEIYGDEKFSIRFVPKVEKYDDNNRIMIFNNLLVGRKYGKTTKQD